MNAQRQCQIWSAAPTPLTTRLAVDIPSVKRLVRAAVCDGLHGLFLAGSCGEGPWLPDGERRRLVRAAVAAARGALKIAVQVTDYSVPRVLDNARAAADAGADYAILATPVVMENPTPERIVAYFAAAAAASPLPLGIYDLGRHRSVQIPVERLREVYLLPRVRLVKDSSDSPERRAIALAARRERPALRLLNGNEFLCLDYLRAGYDGCMFGGAAATGPLLRRIADHVEAGHWAAAAALDAEMTRLLYGLYGGRSFACWLAGLKYYLHRRGLFTTTASYLGYSLTPACRRFVDRQAARAAGRRRGAARTT
jgi:4-hydroxy-tetrahydrodipicolinate synthase